MRCGHEDSRQHHIRIPRHDIGKERVNRTQFG
jgi:hypothetical protein